MFGKIGPPAGYGVIGRPRTGSERGQCGGGRGGEDCAQFHLQSLGEEPSGRKPGLKVHSKSVNEHEYHMIRRFHYTAQFAHSGGLWELPSTCIQCKESDEIYKRRNF